MAHITKFQAKPDADGQLHKGVVGHYKVFSHDGQKHILQIDTYGSADRAVPGKLSQTIQVSEASAKQLWDLLGETYGFGKR